MAGEVVGKYSALLAGTEVGLGSVLHAWHVPLSGHFLSLNQGFLLSKAVQQPGAKSSVALRISLVAATLKSLSPAGRRLTPMLAISVQGLLFSWGHWVGGRGRFGIGLGMVLLGLWAFIQPALLYLLIFGKDIVQVGAYFLNKLQSLGSIQPEQVGAALAGLIVLKVLCSMATAALSWSKRSEKYEARVRQWVRPLPVAQSPRSVPWKTRVGTVLRDMTRPWFVFSLILILVFAGVNDLEQVQWVWLLLRPLAVGFVVFYSLRYFPLDRWLIRLCGKDSAMSLSLSRTLELLREKPEGESIVDVGKA